MATKLTLSINEETVQRAKRISKKRGKSVSKIFEEFINSFPEKEPEKTFSIREISNMLKEEISVPENVDYREFIRENRYQDYLKKRDVNE
ncbi:MAG: hypothetical protein JWQ09_5551 [Segetibacter sp.]|nr:hypothetical protein [Segetibacter sp.]